MGPVSRMQAPNCLSIPPLEPATLNPNLSTNPYHRLFLPPPRSHDQSNRHPCRTAYCAIIPRPNHPSHHRTLPDPPRRRAARDSAAIPTPLCHPLPCPRACLRWECADPCDPTGARPQPPPAQTWLAPTREVCLQFSLTRSGEWKGRLAARTRRSEPRGHPSRRGFWLKQVKTRRIKFLACPRTAPMPRRWLLRVVGLMSVPVRLYPPR